jgi:hypothetical protein
MRFKSVSGLFLTCFFAALLSCATGQIENFLSPDELAYYSDSFDKMRDDIWDSTRDLYGEEQGLNFRKADLSFTDGQLVIRTKTGHFSKGGLSSRFYLKGDFDIQLDCRMDFKFGSYHMDQVFSFVVLDKTFKPGEISFVSIGLALAGGGDSGTLFSHCVLNGKRKKGFLQGIENFKGSLRILKNGKYVRTLYKSEGSAGWNRMNTFRVTDNDMLIGFQLRNFFVKRTAIVATDSISAEIDRFKINSAREIIEEEI